MKETSTTISPVVRRTSSCRRPWPPSRASTKGANAIRRFFADIQDTAPDFRIEIERLESITPHRVLAFVCVTATGRASGLPTATEMPAVNIYDLTDGKIKRIRIFLDRQEALEAAGLRESDKPVS